MASIQAPIQFTGVTEWRDGRSSRLDDSVATEEPLEIRIHDRSLTVTMRTPGHDDELAAGFLWTEGIVDSPNNILAIDVPAVNSAQYGNVIQLQLNGSIQAHSPMRNFFVASSCGICGKASIEAIRSRNLKPPNPELKVIPDDLCEMPSRLRQQQQVFGRTGGLHAAALFGADGNLMVCREDIGRHNAVDKVVGWALLKRRLPLDNAVLVVSGRGGFEIVQKAIAAGIPLLACVSAPSSLAVKLARELGLTLVGFLRERRFVIYAHPERCLA